MGVCFGTSTNLSKLETPRQRSYCVFKLCTKHRRHVWNSDDRVTVDDNFDEVRPCRCSSRAVVVHTSHSGVRWHRYHRSDH
eukprot:m.79833 g.79833  ORF g.79833 m.79833 type:complete len:81 (-) comp10849_c0_seq2:356-598(-)